MKRYKSVDDYIANADNWQAELRRLREILSSTALVEQVKWGAPCYTHKGTPPVAHDISEGHQTNRYQGLHQGGHYARRFRQANQG